MGHFCKVCAFAAEKLTHIGIAFFEKVDPFSCHKYIFLLQKSVAFVFIYSILSELSSFVKEILVKKYKKCTGRFVLRHIFNKVFIVFFVYYRRNSFVP